MPLHRLRAGLCAVLGLSGLVTLTLSGSSVLATIPVGVNPIGTIAVNDTTNHIYVANWGSNTVSVIDGDTDIVVATVPVGSLPHAAAVNTLTNRVYVANYGLFGGNTVSVINGDTNAVIATIGVGAAPRAVAVNEVTNRLYVVNRDSATVSVINGSTNAVIATISPLGSFPAGVGINPTTNRIYVANAGGSTVTRIDGYTNTIIGSITVGSSPVWLDVAPTLNRLYVTNVASNTVSVIDMSTDTVIATVPVGGSPVGVGVDETRGRVYVANFNDDTVSVIDTASNTVAQTIAVGDAPYPVGVNAVTNRVYVGNYSGHTVSVIGEADADGDGVLDVSDNCPVNVNADQANVDGDSAGDACDPDDDNDGIGDAGDNCPLVVNAGQANNDGDATGDECDVDDDNDGVTDASDAFPFDALEWADSDLDGLGNNADPDDDNDRIHDGIDTQPLIASTAFSDLPLGGTTSGTVTTSGGWTISVIDLTSGGVQAAVSGAGTLAVVASCQAGTGAEQIEFDGSGETANIECTTTTSGTNAGSRVTAQLAAGPAPSRTVVRDSTGKIRAKLATGQTVTIGSPVTAAETNAPESPIEVELVAADSTPYGSFTLDPGESVSVQFAVGPAGEEAQLTVVIGEVTATVYGQTRTLLPTSGQSVFYPLALVGPLPPYSAPPASFRLRSTVPIKWRYAANGAVVDSAGAAPMVNVYSVVTCGASTGGTAVTASDAGASGYQYDPVTMTWQFNWKTTGLAAGCYYFTVTNSAARQTDGPFVIQLR